MAFRSSAWLCFLVACLSPVFLTAGVRIPEADGRPESDLVTDLPGQPRVGFKHYSGYVPIGAKKEKALFYWFFEAEGGAQGKPLLLWLNGGPGCSSVAYGAVQELGPFLVRSTTPNLSLNPYSWNKVANLLFLESPVGVGFSYTNRSADLKELGDRVTAEDSYLFLLGWFDKFPDFKSHDFYIAGESYAGHYVPQLVELIYDKNKNDSSLGSKINIKGLMIGNAVLNDETDDMGMVEYAWSHAIISDQVYNTIKKECSFFGSRKNDTKACFPAIRAFTQAYSDIDIYSIYTPVCLSSLTSPHRHNELKLGPRFLSLHERWRTLGGRMLSGYDPCTEEYVESYLNREDVQKALHANITHLSYPYSSCSEAIAGWKDSPPSVLPILSKLMKAGLRVWVYSGDMDGRVPVTSTRFSINKMGMKLKKDNKKKNKEEDDELGGWNPWFYKDQVAGWVAEYEEGLTLATVRGAGHQVPVLTPDRALSLVSHFLDGKALPLFRSF
ncbi:putative carboxypeptidase D [Dioscorea sansibarensis]